MLDAGMPRSIDPGRRRRHRASKTKLRILKRKMLWFVICVLFATLAWLCEGAQINPLEHNDRLNGVRTSYVAEWQWEAWPMKQDAAESPGARQNAALWQDNSVGTWYLFGGQPVHGDSSKVYSDIWKYTVSVRTWERVFPSQSDGGMMTLRANLFDDGYYKKPSKHQNPSVVLCGRASKNPVEKTTKKSPYNFTRRKKQEAPKDEESKSLAVYGPKTTKSNTVWQIDLKDKLWTSYVCCCDTTNSEVTQTMNATEKKKSPHISVHKNLNQTGLDFDRIEDKVDLEQQQHLPISPPPKIKKKKINQLKKKFEKKQVLAEDTNSTNLQQQLPSNTSGVRTVHIFENQVFIMNSSRNTDRPADVERTQAAPPVTNSSPTTPPLTTSTAMSPLAPHNGSDPSVSTQTTPPLPTSPSFSPQLTSPHHSSLETSESTPSGTTERTESKSYSLSPSLVPSNTSHPKAASKYCPEFSEDGQPVSWCDGEGVVLNTVDLSSPDMVLWSFNLTTSHWSQRKLNVTVDPEEWPLCADPSTVRHVGRGSQAFILCDALVNHTKKVFRLDSHRQLLEYLGTIELPPFFGSEQGHNLWVNDTELVLHLVITDSETILLMAYDEDIALWILNQDQFEPIQKLWRGSALKWFKKYSAPLYNLQIITESNGQETVLVVNPRPLSQSEWWPSERGRFIVRIFKNDMKHRELENRTRDQNLTFQHLQSEPGPADPAMHSTFRLKVWCFFGLSLLLLCILAAVLFARRCSRLPRFIARMRPIDCQKSPPIVRYSVIPDDLLYSMAKSAK